MPGIGLTESQDHAPGGHRLEDGCTRTAICVRRGGGDTGADRAYLSEEQASGQLIPGWGMPRAGSGHGWTVEIMKGSRMERPED
eukprot:7385884-Prymnesium_polylepis.1